jgi:hypothetical protein
VTGVEPTDDSVDAIADALLVVSRLLVAISARSIAGVDDTLTIPQFRALVIMANVGPVKLTSLARLDRTGLVVRADSARPRDTVVGLTRRGQSIVDKVTLIRHAEITNIVSMMPLGQRRELVTALGAFASAGGENVVDVDDLL